jgi:hypothetical protein
MALDSFQEVLAVLHASMNSADIPHMVAGSVAASAHGLARSTQDIDVVIDPTREALDQMLAGFVPTEFYVSAEAAHDAFAHRGMFNVIAFNAGWKIDFILRRQSAHAIAEFARRRPLEIGGAVFDVATAEDTIIAKLAWAHAGGSARQLEDVNRLIIAQGNELDTAYLLPWIERLGLTPLWQRARTSGS